MYLHRGAKLPRCDWSLDYEDGVSLRLPHLPEVADPGAPGRSCTRGTNSSKVTGKRGGKT